MNWRACNFADAVRLRVRRQLRRSTWRAEYDSNSDGLIDSRRASATCRASRRAAYVNKHRDARSASTLRDGNTHFVNAQHELRLHPVGQHAPDLQRLDDLRRLLRRLGLRLGRARSTPTRRSSAARTRSGTRTGTTRWGGRCPPSTRRHPDAGLTPRSVLRRADPSGRRAGTFLGWYCRRIVASVRGAGRGGAA